jgi:hypothetical protein
MDTEGNMSEDFEYGFLSLLGLKSRKPRQTKTSLERANEKHGESNMPEEVHLKYLLQHVFDRYNRGKD